MAIDKALNQAPLGLDASFSGGVMPGVNTTDDDIEIEIEDPEEVTIRTGDLEIEIDPDAIDEDEFNENLADTLDEGQLTELAGDLIGEFEEDVSSRKDWIQTYVDGLELLGMKIDDRTEPWPGACGVYHPMLSEALVKFQAETMMETFPAAGPVKTEIIGKEERSGYSRPRRHELPVDRCDGRVSA